MTGLIFSLLNLISVMAARVEIKGLEEIVDALKKMAKTFTPEDVQEVLTGQGEILAKSMQNLAPVNTGRLRRSIGVLKRDNSKFPYTVLVGIDYSKDVKGSTMTLAALASVVEYGAAARYPKKNKPYKRVLIDGEWRTMTQEKPFAPIAARPFIRPAFDTNAGMMQKNIIEGLYKIASNRGKELGFDGK